MKLELRGVFFCPFQGHRMLVFLSVPNTSLGGASRRFVSRASPRRVTKPPRISGPRSAGAKEL